MGCGTVRVVRTQMSHRRRVRPGDGEWPSEADWADLERQLGGRLIRLESPLAACRTTPDGPACVAALERLDDPYYLGDQPALTQASGYLDAWQSAPSAYAVAAETTEDVVAAVDFARAHDLRLVVKGGGHSYQGTSNSADSLLIWTRAMNGIDLHSTFVPDGCDGRLAPQPAVTVGPGAIWMSVYNAVTTRAGRYVQGGGCLTVGVAGLIQSGGFGPDRQRGQRAGSVLGSEGRRRRRLRDRDEAHPQDARPPRAVRRGVGKDHGPLGCRLPQPHRPRRRLLSRATVQPALV